MGWVEIEISGWSCQSDEWLRVFGEARSEQPASRVFGGRAEDQRFRETSLIREMKEFLYMAQPPKVEY